MMLKLQVLMTMTLVVTLATFVSALQPPCQAIYYSLLHVPRLWPPANRVHLCDALVWKNRTANFTFFHEVYNPEPDFVLSNERVVADVKRGFPDVRAMVLSRYLDRVREEEEAPVAECQSYLLHGVGEQWLAWGTNEARVARLECPIRSSGITWSSKKKKTQSREKGHGCPR